MMGFPDSILGRFRSDWSDWLEVEPRFCVNKVVIFAQILTRTLDWGSFSVSLESLIPKSIIVIVDITESFFSDGAGWSYPLSGDLGNPLLVVWFHGNQSFVSSLVLVSHHQFDNYEATLGVKDSFIMEVFSSYVSDAGKGTKGLIPSIEVSCCRILFTNWNIRYEGQVFDILHKEKQKYTTEKDSWALGVKCVAETNSFTELLCFSIEWLSGCLDGGLDIVGNFITQGFWSIQDDGYTDSLNRVTKRTMGETGCGKCALDCCRAIRMVKNSRIVQILGQVDTQGFEDVEVIEEFVELHNGYVKKMGVGFARVDKFGYKVMHRMWIVMEIVIWRISFIGFHVQDGNYVRSS